MDLETKTDKFAIFSFILGLTITLLWVLLSKDLGGDDFIGLTITLMGGSLFSLFLGIAAARSESRKDGWGTESRGMFLAFAGIMISGFNLMMICLGFNLVFSFL